MDYSLLYRTHMSLRLTENQASKLALAREFCSLSSSIYVLGSSLSHFCSLLWVDLLSVLVVSHSWWGCSVSSAFAGSNTNYLSVNSTGDTILELEVHFGDGVIGENGGIGDITDSG